MRHPLLRVLLRPNPKVEYVSSAQDNSNASTYNFTVNVGRQTQDKIFVIAIHGKDDSTGFFASTATLGGVSVQPAIESSIAGNLVYSSLWYLNSNSGRSLTGSQTLSITFSESVTSAGYGLWTLFGINNMVALSGSSGEVSTGTTQIGGRATYGRCSFIATTQISGSGGSQTRPNPDYDIAGAEMVSSGSGIYPPGMGGCTHSGLIPTIISGEVETAYCQVHLQDGKIQLVT